MKKKEKIDKQQSEKNPLVEKILNMYKDSVNDKSQFVDKWKENFKAYNGELFKRNTSRKSAGNAIPNHIFSTVETVKPIMFTNPPKNVVYPTKEDGFIKAMMIQESLEYEWKRTKLLPKILDSLTNGLIYGTFIIGLFWDGKADRGLGQIVPKLISPFNFFLDPMADTIEEASYCMYACYKSLAELKKYYPDKAELLEANATKSLDADLTFGRDKDNVPNQLLYIECYLRDYEMESVIEEIDGEKYKVERQKYPGGRRVIIAGDVLLSDGKNPYENGRFPFTAWRCYTVPGQFWGVSEVEMLVSVQKEICSLYNDVIDNAHLNGNAPWVVDKNSGVEKGSLSNDKGLVIRKNPGTEVRRETPPSMPAYIQNIINDLKYDVQVVSGVFDATRGERPASITSGIAIQALQDSSQGRIKLKTQNLEYLLADLGSMWLSYMQQFWTLPRTIRIMGGEYIPNESRVMPNGDIVRFKEVDKDMIDGDFDVEIKTGSTMAVNKSAKFEQILRMAQTTAEDGLPLIDREVVLEYSDLENTDDIILRFREKAKQMSDSEMYKAEMQNQMTMQQQVMNHQNDMENMQLNMESQMRAKQIDIDGKMALQEQKEQLQSKVKKVDLDSISIEELLNYVQTLSEEELKELIKVQPELATVLTKLQQLGV